MMPAAVIYALSADRRWAALEQAPGSRRRRAGGRERRARGATP
jgi:hypothetical protein